MKTVPSYCSARMFLRGLLPMVAMSPRQPRGAVNDTDPQRCIRPTVEHPKRRGRPASLHSKRIANGLTRRAIAAIALVAGILALPLLRSLEVPAAPSREARPDVIWGITIAPSLLDPQEDR
jgi:hypothetical protein